MEAVSSLSGGALLSRLHNYTRHGDSSIASFSQSIMKCVCSPIYHMIAKWILYGELQDPYNEFFIGCRTPTHHAHQDQQMWNEVYFIRLSMLPTFISVPLAKQIFLIGKSINFIRHCKLKLASMTIVNPSIGARAKISNSSLNQQQHNRNHSHNKNKEEVLHKGKGTNRADNGRKKERSEGKNKKVEYSFGRKYINRAGMARPSVAEALGYKSAPAIAVNGPAGYIPSPTRKPPGDMSIDEESTIVTTNTINNSYKRNKKYYDVDVGEDDGDVNVDDVLNDIDMNQEEEDVEEEVEGEEDEKDQKKFSSSNKAKANAAHPIHQFADDLDICDSDGSGDVDLNMQSSAVVGILVREKDLEQSIRSLQYNHVMSYQDSTADKDNTKFEEWIIRISSSVDRKLLYLLENRFHLTSHLSALKKFILLGQGDFVICLMDNVGQELKKRANQLYRHNLTGLLEGALRGSNAQYEPSFILDRIGIRLLDDQPGDTGWEIFSLDYMIDFPLSAIIHANALTKYRAIFHLLWRIKRVEWVLADSWEQLMTFKRQRGLVILPKLKPIIHKCTLYRSRMIHVINNISAFLMFEVMETAWEKLKDGIMNRANNLDDVVALHDCYLDEILNKALLTPVYELLNMQMQQVIQTILRFCGLEEALLFDANNAMQRKQNTQHERMNTSVLSGNWGVTEDSGIDNPVGTVDGIPYYVITRLDDAYNDFCIQLDVLMNMLNEQVS